MRDVEGRVAFITGGMSGIGLGIAKALAAGGMKLVLTYRSANRIDEALAYFEAHGDTAVHYIQLDVTDRDAVARAADEAERVFGKVHLLCNSAGVNLLGPMDRATFEDWDWILDVNLKGVINTLVTFIPRLKAHGEPGHVVNVASMSSFISGPMAGIYATSKFAVRGLSEGLRYNLAPYNIGVSLVCPGLTRTRIFQAPLHRPAHLSNTAFAIDEQTLKRMEDVHAAGMDPDEVGIRVLAGLARGDFYIFSHAEFRDELRAACEELVAAVPDGPVDPRRLEIEGMRRRAKAEAQRIVDALTEAHREGASHGVGLGVSGT